MMQIGGCRLDRIDRETAGVWLEHILGEGGAPIELDQPAWVLCHCDDGVTWGRWAQGNWRLGSTAFPDLCPVPSRRSLVELRVFSATFEALIWRGESELLGRMLTDEPPGPSDDPMEPHDEDRLLLWGHIVDERDGFTRVTNGTGMEQALPLTGLDRTGSASPRLRVRHYFGRDDRSGCVRVAASRLMEFK